MEFQLFLGMMEVYWHELIGFCEQSSSSIDINCVSVSQLYSAFECKLPFDVPNDTTDQILQYSFRPLM